MTQSRQETYDWYDDAASLEAPRTRAQVLPGVPDSFRNFGWWMSGLALSTLWMLESWTSASLGDRGVGDMAEGVWSLLLSLGICYGIYNFSKVHSRPLAHLLCVASAVVLLLNHANLS